MGFFPEVSGSSSLQAYQFSVLTYGAKGDGQLVGDGVMSNGTSTVTCATTNPFKPTDVGKLIQVIGALTILTGTTAVGTITGYTSPSTVTVSFTSTNAVVSGGRVAWATDDTAAFLAAEAAAEAYMIAHGAADMVIPPAPVGLYYGIGGPLLHTKAGNSQIPLPNRPDSGYVGTFRIIGTNGSAFRGFNQVLPQVGGSCVLSFQAPYASAAAQNTDINANGNPSVFGGPTGPNGFGTSTVHFSSVLIDLRGISVYTAFSADGFGIGAIGLWGCLEFNATEVTYGALASFEAGDLPTASLGTGVSIGFLSSGTGNQNNCCIRNVECSGGYTYGLFATEHVDIHTAEIFYCWGGLCVVGTFNDGTGTSLGSTHKTRGSNIGLEGNTHPLLTVGIGSTNTGPTMDLDLEMESAFSITDFAGNGASLATSRGDVRINKNPGGAISTVNPTGLNIIDENTTLPGPGTAWTLVINTAFQNPVFRWANVVLTGGTGITTVQLAALRGGSAAPAMTTIYTQAAGALVSCSVRVPPGGWIQVNGTTVPTAVPMYD